MGCQLENEEDCATETEIARTGLNFVNMNAYPNLIGDNAESIISYNLDFTHYKFLDPYRAQNTNLYFMQSSITLKDNIFDVFD